MLTSLRRFGPSIPRKAKTYTRKNSFKRYEFDFERHEGLTTSQPYIEICEPQISVFESRTNSTSSNSERAWSFGERPPAFQSVWRELIFLYTVCMPGVLVEYFLLGFIVVYPVISREQLSTSGEGSDKTNHLIWPFLALPMTIGVSILSLFCFSEFAGPTLCYKLAAIWTCVWSLVSGIASSYWFLCLCRAMTGLGIGMLLGSSTCITDRIYPPGRRKQLLLSIYDCSSIFGTLYGLLTAALLTTYTPDRSAWYFWIGALHALSCAVASLISLSSERVSTRCERKAIGFDWMGSLVIFVGLFFILFAVTEAATAVWGWATSYIPCSMVIGLTLIGVFLHVETCGYATPCPLIPPDVMKETRVKSSLLLMALNGGGQIGLLYILRPQIIASRVNITPLETSTWYIAFFLTGLLMVFMFSEICPWHKYITEFSTTALFIGSTALLVAFFVNYFSQTKASYWTFVFPSMIYTGIGYYVVSMITTELMTTISSTNTAKRASNRAYMQSFIMASKFVGMSFIVAVAANIYSPLSTPNSNKDSRSVAAPPANKNVYWLSFVCAILGLIITAFSTDGRDTLRRTAILLKRRSGRSGRSSYWHDRRVQSKRTEAFRLLNIRKVWDD